MHQVVDRVVPVLILNFNGWEDTRAAIGEMYSYLEDIWLIDNGSDVDLTASVQAEFPKIRTIRFEENCGWAGGYNKALRVAQSEGFDVVYLLNNDGVAQPGAVQSAAAALRGEDRIAAVGSIILTNGGSRISFDGEIWSFRAGADKDRTTFSSELRPARTLHGAGFALNLQAFAELGPFCEEYFLYWEEVDWFARATQRGWKLLVDGSSVVMHLGQASDSNGNEKYYSSRNRFLALRRGVCVSGTPESLLSLIADQLWIIKNGAAATRSSIENGLIDGLLSRFGKRRRTWPASSRHVIITMLRLAILPYRVGRKFGWR